MNPVPVMKLVEVIKGAKTDQIVVNRSVNFVKALKKQAVVAADAPGFIVNRIARLYYVESLKALEENVCDFQIIDGQISGSNITLNADNSTIFKTDQGPGTDSGESNLALKDEYYIDFSPTGENPDNAYVKFGPNFTVDKDGILIASGATFIGTITASAGLIGGFTTDSHSFHSSNIFISGSPKTGGLPLDEYMFISTSKFNVKENGDVTGSSVLFSGGKIGGFEIDSTQINSSNDKLILKSTGEITGSQVLFSRGKIGGFNIESDKLINEEETVELFYRRKERNRRNVEKVRDV